MNQVQSLKQSIEATLGKENVVIDIHQLSANDFYNITYYATNAAAEDRALSVGVAWESKETTDLKVRYEKYAKAQAWLKDSALYLPATAYSGAATVVSRIQPFSGAYA